MVQYCCAFNCTNSSDVNPEFIFHSFPSAEKDNERRQKWIHAIKRKNWQPGKNTKLCSAHFLPEDYDPPVICGKYRLKNSAIPSVFDYPVHLQPKKVSERRPLIRLDADLIEPEVNDAIFPVVELVVEEPFHKSVAVQTDLTGIDLTNTLNNLRREKKLLQQQLKRRNARINRSMKPQTLSSSRAAQDEECSDTFLKLNEKIKD